MASSTLVTLMLLTLLATSALAQALGSAPAFSPIKSPSPTLAPIPTLPPIPPIPTLPPIPYATPWSPSSAPSSSPPDSWFSFFLVFATCLVLGVWVVRKRGKVVDGFYFLVDEILPVSDEKYAEELQFQEALMASVITSKLANNGTLTLLPLLSSPKEAGESSCSFCEICVERKDRDQMFKTESCEHSFCSDCIGKHVATKIQESITIVRCPGLDCKGVIELDACRAVLPKDVFERWDKALCETLFGSQSFYCPFKDCSAMLLNDNEEGEAITESECPFCHRLFCAVCYVPWHPGVDCEEFQKLNEDERGRDDLMLRELVKEKKWKRCPQCKYFVERNEGCLHMTCRCTFQFCYGCGAQWTTNHGACRRD